MSDLQEENILYSDLVLVGRLRGVAIMSTVLGAMLSAMFFMFFVEDAGVPFMDVVAFGLFFAIAAALGYSLRKQFKGFREDELELYRIVFNSKNLVQTARIKSLENDDRCTKIVNNFESKAKEAQRALEEKERFVLEEIVKAMVRHAKFADLAFETKKLNFDDKQERNQWFRGLRRDSLKEAIALLTRTDGQFTNDIDRKKVLQAFMGNLKPIVLKDVVEKLIQEDFFSGDECSFSQVLITFAFKEHEINGGHNDLGGTEVTA